MEIYKKYNVFPENVLLALSDFLNVYNDKGLIAKIQDDDEKVMELVTKYFYCG